MLCDAHVPARRPSCARGRLLLDIHSFPRSGSWKSPIGRKEAILKVGFSDGIYGRSRGGPDLQRLGVRAPALPGWSSTTGVSAGSRGKPKAGGNWVLGFMTRSPGFAHQGKQYRDDWLHYAPGIGCGRTDPNGHLQMPGSRHDAIRPLDKRRWYYAKHAEARRSPTGSATRRRFVPSGRPTRRK